MAENDNDSSAITNVSEKAMRRIQRQLWIGSLGLAIVAVTSWLCVASVRVEADRQSARESGLSKFEELIALAVAELGSVDIAQINLLCAQGLPGSEDLDISRCVAIRDAMAARVRTETERHYYRFQRNPSEFENSEGFFRMIMLGVVLAEDFGVKFNPGKRVTAEESRIGDGFFKDARDVFLHGLLGPKRQGTCSSLPVLQVAVGRRLGYPLKLVTTKGHLFVRWEDARERFNIEAIGSGVNRFSDDYYRHWPFEISEEEIQAESYLKSLTPAEELAVFLSIRGMCWQEAGRYAEAEESFREAARLSLGCRSYRIMQEQMEQKARSNGKPFVASARKGE